MTPVERPTAAHESDGGPGPACVAGSGRLPAARVDLFLDPRVRLTEQERSLMTAMLTDLVEAVADEFSAALSEPQAANDEPGQVFERLWLSGLLDIPDLVALVLRRAEEERIAAAIRSGPQGNTPRFLQSFVSDEDPAVSAAAMALVLAKGRRRDRFGGPKILFDDISAEAAVALANAVAAAMRSELTKGDEPVADERLGAAADKLLARHDEGNRLEVCAFDLVNALDRAGRLDESLIRSALTQGEVGLLLEAFGRRGGIPSDSAWQYFTGASGQLAMLLKICSVSRDLAGEVVALVSGLSGSDPETEIGRFDELSDDEVEHTRKWLRLAPSYRSAVEILDSGRGQRSV
jgi:hypothetical protein